jgi:hypothetical protein
MEKHPPIPSIFDELESGGELGPREVFVFVAAFFGMIYLTWQIIS